MDPEEALRRERDQEVVRREMGRKSRDTIRIYNPLDFDFVFYYDGYPNKVSARSTKDVERYKAVLFFKKISEFMIGQLALAKGNELLEERRKRGVPDFLDKYVENKEIWDKVPRLDDEQLLKQIGEQVVLGLVEEYGLDVIEGRQASAMRSDPTKGVQDQIVDLLTKKIAAQDAPHPEEKPIKAKLAMEVTADGD